MGNAIVGWVAMALGVLCIVAAVRISIREAARSDAAGAFPAKSVVSIGKVVAEILKAFGKLAPAAQLLVVGLVLFGGGIWVLAAAPI